MGAAKVAVQLPRPVSLRCILIYINKQPNLFVLTAANSFCHSALQCLALDRDMLTAPLKQIKDTCRDVAPKIAETPEGVMVRPSRPSSLRPRELGTRTVGRIEA